jgi:glucan phosphorylase
VLAGDTIRAAADLDVPMVAVTLLHRHGYFYQRLDEQGRQSEEPVACHAKAKDLLDKAEANCLISNSVQSKVTVEPTIT